MHAMAPLVIAVAWEVAARYALDAPTIWSFALVVAHAREAEHDETGHFRNWVKEE